MGLFNKLFNNNVENWLETASDEKYEKEHSKAESRHREHGWYLPNDD